MQIDVAAHWSGFNRPDHPSAASQTQVRRTARIQVDRAGSAYHPQDDILAGRPAQNDAGALHEGQQRADLALAATVGALGRAGSRRNSSHVQLTGSPTRPSTRNVQSANGERGVGPAERTGKSWVTYWPGGTRPAVSGARRLPEKAREMKLSGMRAYLLVADCRSETHSVAPPGKEWHCRRVYEQLRRPSTGFYD